MNELIVKITGQVQTSNFGEFKEYVLEKIKEADKPLVSDQDFADAEQMVKDFKAAEDAIKKAKDESMKEMVDIDELFSNLDEVSNALRTTRLSLDKKVKTEKDNRKQQVIDDGCKRLKDAVNLVAESLPEIRGAFSVRAELFKSAVSGKKKIESMIEAVESLLDGEIQTLSDARDVISKNVKLIDSCEFKELFPDRATLVCVPTSELQATIDGRIAKHKLAEKERKEAEERKDAEQQAQPERQEEPKTQAADTEVVRQHTPMRVSSGSITNAYAKKNFTITVELYCTKDKAVEIAELIDDKICGDDSVVKIKFEEVKLEETEG